MNTADGPMRLRITPELEVLVGLFFPSLDSLGRFREITQADLPVGPRKLLWHDDHMTVALEAYHHCDLDVCVLRSLMTDTHYARHVLLACHDSGQIVQYGICRLNLTFLDQAVSEELRSEQIPLGRLLVNHDVMRKVRLLSLWRIEPSPTLRGLLQLAEDTACFGRTALIYCNEVPAVELLEVVSES